MQKGGLARYRFRSYRSCHRDCQTYKKFLLLSSSYPCTEFVFYRILITQVNVFYAIHIVSELPGDFHTFWAK
jgi:hypothetical protein